MKLRSIKETLHVLMFPYYTKCNEHTFQISTIGIFVILETLVRNEPSP